MAHRKCKGKAKITQQWVAEYAHSLFQILQQLCIPVRVVVAGPFVGLTFGISESVTIEQLADCAAEVATEMIACLKDSEQVERLLGQELQRYERGLTDGMRPSAN